MANKRQTFAFIIKRLQQHSAKRTITTCKGTKYGVKYMVEVDACTANTFFTFRGVN